MSVYIKTAIEQLAHAQTVVQVDMLEDTAIKVKVKFYLIVHTFSLSCQYSTECVRCFHSQTSYSSIQLNILIFETVSLFSYPSCCLNDIHTIHFIFMFLIRNKSNCRNVLAYINYNILYLVCTIDTFGHDCTNTCGHCLQNSCSHVNRNLRTGMCVWI